MNNLIFDAELRTVYPQACHLNFTTGKDEPVINGIYNHPDAAKTLDLWSIQRVINAMDEAGVSAGLLSGLPWMNESAHAEQNDYIYDCLRNNPTRFKGLYMAYPQNIDQTADAILALDKHYYVGVEIIPKWQNCHIDDEKLDPIYQAVQQKDLFLKAYTAHITQTLEGDSPYRLLQLLKRYPRLKVLAPHLGGLLCLYGLMPSIKDLLSNTYFIGSVTATMPMVKFALDVNSNNVLFGTDFPFNHCHDVKTALREIQTFDLNPDSQHKLLWGNAARLFSLDGNT